jgi:hypothetical protein
MANVTTQEELETIVAGLTTRLIEIGVTEEQSAAIYRLMEKSGVQVDITQGREMAERFMSVLRQALEMIAYGEGDYISPTIDQQVTDMLQGLLQ